MSYEFRFYFLFFFGWNIFFSTFCTSNKKNDRRTFVVNFSNILNRIRFNFSTSLNVVCNVWPLMYGYHQLRSFFFSFSVFTLGGQKCLKKVNKKKIFTFPNRKYFFKILNTQMERQMQISWNFFVFVEIIFNEIWITF